MDFEWDDTKAADNRTKHGTSFFEAAPIFDDPLSVTTADPDHSDDEERFVQIGFSSYGNLLFVVFADRNDFYRVISAREATRAEKRIYEEST